MDKETIKLMNNNRKLIKQYDGDKIKGEAESRRNMLSVAKAQGCEGEVRQILERTDKLLYNCSNPVEKQQIIILATTELYRLLNVQGGLIMDGVELIPPNPDNPNDKV